MPRRDQLADLALVHAAQPHLRHRPVAFDVGDQVGEWMPGLEFGIAESTHDEDPAELQLAGDVASQEQAGAVGPVEIVKNQ